MSDRTFDGPLKLGTVLRNKWRLDALLGRGGMATVFSATHRNGMRGAIKLLHPELSRQTEIKNRFLREGYLANKIDHPGIVRIIDDDITDDGLCYLVMELLEGETLKQRWVREDRHLPVMDVIELADSLLGVLEVAHREGIVHRDIKPDNVFLVNGGGAKLLDFGIARLKEATADTTHTGATLGTPAFMAPEQALAHWSKVDARSDLFALGATMWTVLSGRLVHAASTIPELLVSAATKQAQPFATVAPAVPDELAAVIDRALAFEREDRWPDARSMAAALIAAKAAVRAKGTIRLSETENPFYTPAQSAPNVASGVELAPTSVLAAHDAVGAAPTQVSTPTLADPTPVRLQQAWPVRLTHTGPVVISGSETSSGARTSRSMIGLVLTLAFFGVCLAAGLFVWQKYRSAASAEDAVDAIPVPTVAPVPRDETVSAEPKPPDAEPVKADPIESAAPAASGVPTLKPVEIAAPSTAPPTKPPPGSKRLPPAKPCNKLKWPPEPGCT